jgi:hypothetical protein
MAYMQKVIDANDIKEHDALVHTGGTEIQVKDEVDTGTTYTTYDGRFVESTGTMYIVDVTPS